MKIRFKYIFSLVLALLFTLTLVACGDPTPVPSPTMYTVTFVMDGGSPQVAAREVEKDSKITKPATDPTKAGFEFIGWYKDANLNTEWKFDVDTVTADVILYAGWKEIAEPVVEFTVTFNAGAGEVNPESVKVADGGKVSEPTALRPGFVVEGWYKDAGHTQPWDFAVDTVDANITLYVKWAEDTGAITIVSQDQFYELLLGETEYQAGQVFELGNDLDFTGFTWDGSLFTEVPERVFNFVFDGKGYTVSNITFTTPNQGGLFSRMDGGAIKNLVLDNVHITSGAQGGILIGRILNGSEVAIENVTILNSSATSSGVGNGALIGHIQGAGARSFVDVKDIVILNTKLTSSANAVGGLVGDLESSELTISDVLVDVDITTTGERVGGLIGEARRNSGATATVPNIIVNRALVRANLIGLRYLGGITGRADSNIIGGTLPTAPEVSGPIGEINDVIVILNNQQSNLDDRNSGAIARSNLNTPTNMWAIAYNTNIGNLGGQHLPEEFLVDTVGDLPAEAVANFTNWDTTGELPSLRGHNIDLGHVVTLTIGEDSQVQYVRDGGMVLDVFVEADQDGKIFYGWLLDGVAFTGPVVDDVTLTVEYRHLFTLSFETNGGGVETDQKVFDGLTGLRPDEDPERFGYIFLGWFADAELTTAFDFDAPITNNTVVYAGWEAADLEEFTVTFETNGGSEVADITVLDGATLTLPIPPTRAEYVFGGWYTDTDLEVPFNAGNPITADITLYARWIEEGATPEGIAINSAQDFYNMATGSNDFDLAGQYYLAADIDFTGFTWVGVAATFTGELNGNGQTLRNLTWNNTNTAVYNGLFHNLNGAKVHNFTIEDFNFTSSVATTRSALIAGQAQGGEVATIIEKIAIRNSSISANEYVAAIVGRATGSSGAKLQISNIVLDDVTVRGYYVAGVVADLDGTSGGTTIRDVWAKVDLGPVDIEGLGRAVGLAERLGGIISRFRADGNVLVERVYVDITGVSDKWAAGIVGDVNKAFLEVRNAFVTGALTANANSGRAIAGNGSSNLNYSSTFEYNFTGNGTSGLGGTVVESAPDQIWWDNNLAPIANSHLWGYNEETGLVELVLLGNVESGGHVEEKFYVTFNTNSDVILLPIEVSKGETVELPTVNRDGYEFLGWFKDAGFTEEWNLDDEVEDNITLYAKWRDNVEPALDVVTQTGVVELLPGQTFKLEVQVTDENLYKLEVDHSFEGTLPEFSVYASQEDPTGGQEEAFATLGVVVTFNEDTQTWDIDFGEAITNTFVDQGEVTFYLVAHDVDGNASGSMYEVTPEMTFKYELVLLTDTREVTLMVAGVVHEVIEVASGTTVNLPIVHKDNFVFLGWFTDELGNDEWLAEELVTEDITLYAVYEESDFDATWNAIYTAEQFMDFLGQEHSGIKFFLARDIDLSEELYEITDKGVSFAGTLDGNNKTLTGLEIKSTDYGGLFPRVNGATILNLVIDGFEVTASGRAGVLIGRVENNLATVDNVKVLNSFVTGNDSNGLGGLIGHVAKDVNINNVIIDNVDVTNAAKNTGGLVGRIDGDGTLVNITNVIVTEVYITSATGSGDTGNGLLIGYTANKSSETTVNNVVITNSDANNTASRGVVVGYYRSPSVVTVSNVYIDVEFTEGTIKSGVQGHANNAEHLISVLTVYGRLFNSNVSGTGSQGLLVENIQPETDFELWLLEKLPSIYSNEFFSYIFGVLEPIEVNTIAFEVNGGDNLSNMTVIKGEEFLLPTPFKEGYEFLGWFKEADLIEEWGQDDDLENDITLYAKWRDSVNPELNVVTDTGVVVLLPGDNFVLTVQATDENLFKLEVDHSFEGTLPEFSVYASQEDPTGGQQEAFATLGVVVTFNEDTQTWAIDFGETITNTFVNEGEVTFYLVAHDVDGNASGSMYEVTPEMTFRYELDRASETQSVSLFLGGELLEILSVPKGTMLTNLPQPTKEDFVFTGWFKNEDLTEPWLEDDIVEADIQLYGEFEPAPLTGTAINTVEEFYAMATGDNTALAGEYYLTDDLDFENYNWVWVNNKTFMGKLNGNGKTISNLTIQGGSDRTGIWRVLGASEIKNINFVNIDISSTTNTRIGLFAGETDTSGVINLINISIDGLELTGNNSNGVGGFVGYARTEMNFENISIKNAIITNDTQAVGLFVGRVGEGSSKFDLNVENVYIANSVVKGSARVGGLFGEVNGGSSTEHIKVNLINLAILNTELSSTGDYVGGVIGRHQAGTPTTFENVNLNTKITGSRIGHIATDKAVGELINVWFSGTLTGTQNGTMTTDVLENHPDSEWFEANLPTLFENPMFNGLLTTLPQLQTVTLMDDEVIIDELPVNNGDVIEALPTLTKDYFNFLGWFTSEDVEWDLEDEVLVDVVLYAKWEEIEYIEDAVITFDFNGLNGNESSDLFNQEENLNAIFSDSDHFIAASSSGKFYAGTDRIKFSTASVNGDLTLLFEQNIKIKTIVVYAHAWTGDIATLEINGNTPVSLENEILRYVIELDESTDEITLIATKRVLVYKMELYGADADIIVPEYEVTLNPDNGDDLITQLVEENNFATIPLEEPTREGYNFLGWYLGDVEFEFSNIAIVRNIEITAKWELIVLEYIEDASVLINFDDLTGNGTGISGDYLDNKYNPEYLSNVVINGSVYDGNGTGSTNYANTSGLIKFGTGSATGSLKFVFDGNVLIDKVVIYAAGWTASEGQIRVNSINPAEGNNNIAVTQTRYVILLDEGTNEITIETSSKRAFLFAVEFYGPEIEVPEAPEIIEWEVSFDLGYEGAPSIDPVIVEDGNSVNVPNNPTREGYTFDGWLFDEVEFDFDEPITSNIQLVAKWVESDEEPAEEVSINTSATGYPSGYNDFTWTFDEIVFTGIQLTKNGNAIQGNSNRTPNSNISSNYIGLIQKIIIQVNTGNQTAAAGAKFYVEVADNSNFTNSIKYGFGSGYTDDTNITLSSGSTITDVLRNSSAIISIDVSGDNANFVRFYWESGASYFTNIDVLYYPN